MNMIGIALAWCVVQVTLVGLLAAGLYLFVRRLRPAAGSPVVLSGLAMVVVLSLLVPSPWPRWTIPDASPLPPGEGQVASVEGRGQNDPARQTADKSHGLWDAGQGAGDEVVSVANRSSGAALLWQSLWDELANPQTTTATSAWHWPGIMAVLLLAAMACGLGWLVLGVLAVRWQRLRSRPVLDGELLELVDLLRAELGCRRPVDVRQTDDLTTAATIGWRRPVLLLSADWSDWTADQRRAVLAHEIVHARSHDFIALLVGQLGLALHFYHPLLHWLIGRLRLEQELAADAAAASVSGGQRQYLMTIAELALRQPDRLLLWPARTFLPTRTTFLRRIAMLRDSKPRFNRLSPVVRLITVGAVLLCGLLVAGLRGPAADPQAAAEDRAVAAGDNHIDTSFLTETSTSMIIMRPSAAFARPEFADLASLLGNPGRTVPTGTQLTDFRQITIVSLESDLPSSSGPFDILVAQWDKPAVETHFAARVANKEYTVKPFHGKKLYVPTSGPDVILQYDARTAILARSEQEMGVYLAGKRGVLPRWFPARMWESFQGDQFLFAADVAMVRRLIQTVKSSVARSSPIVRAAFAAAPAMWQDTTVLAAGARLDDRLAAHAWAATKDAASSEKVRRAAEALKTLFQNYVKDTRTVAEADKGSHRAILLAMLDAHERLLQNLKLQQEGNDVKLETSAPRSSVVALATAAGQERLPAPTRGRYTASAFLGAVKYENPNRSAAEQQADRDGLGIYQSVQEQLIASRFVLQAALRDPNLAKLPSVQRAVAAGDAETWLRSQLQVRSLSPGKANLIEVACSRDDPQEAAALVNVVVDSFFKEVVNPERDRKLQRLKKLNQSCAEREKELKKFAEQQPATEKEAPPPKSAAAVEKKLASLKTSDPVFNELKKEIERFKAAAHAAPRVILLIPARVPERPNRLW